MYSCPACHTKSGRAIIVDGKIKIINTSRGIKHIVATALILKDNNILLTQRRTYPFGLETPVGHVEYDESLEQALRREVYEEVGLMVTGETLLAQIEQPISYCRYGVAIEEWAVFLVNYKGHDFIGNNEIEEIVWLPLSDLPLDKLTPNTRVILEALGYIENNSLSKVAKAK